MDRNRSYGALDCFRIAAALLVTAIHTSPLESVDLTLDFIFTRVIARMAVPFFIMVTGYFTIADGCFFEKTDGTRVKRFIRRNVLIYILASIAYAPIGVYARHYDGITAAGLFRKVFLEGTFYHLWYFPAVIFGVILVWLMLKVMPLKMTAAVSVVLYAVGLLGDSYYGISVRIPMLNAFYAQWFKVSEYTRCGLFYVPIFLIMGAYMTRVKRPSKPISVAGFMISLFMMTAEGLILRKYDMQRHDSMYILLPLCMYFLFSILLSLEIGEKRKLRSASAYIYILHPACIVAVRLAVKITGLDFLVDNSFVNYLAVCLLSCASAFIILKLGNTRRHERKMSRSWIELNMKNLEHNIKLMRSLLPETCKLMPAVKANAYGHGALLVSKKLNELGVDSFCVASADEGVELRMEGIVGDILILGYTAPENFGLLCEFDLIQAVVDYNYAKILNKYGKPVRVHVKIDSGMHRLGERSENISEILKIFKLKNLKIEGIFTHMSASESREPNDEEQTYIQAKAFENVLTQIREHGIPVPKVHCQSSYGVINYPELAADYARIGIAMYGMLSTRQDTENCGLDLRPVLSVKTLIASVKQLHKGEHAGYGLEFTTEQDMKIAVLAIGYADGVPRLLACKGGSVLINGRRAPIIGKICMDQMIVDITDIPEAKADDIAVVIGRSGELEITACEIAERTDTIANEVLSRLGGRLERIAV